MNRIAIVFAAAVFAAASVSLFSAQAAAQGMFKCKDAAGKITYSGSECHLLGLTSAGEVTGRASVTPALKFQPQAPEAPRPAPAAETPAKSAPPVSSSGDGAAPKEEGDKRCFTVKAGKGSATRCNDTPG